ncbi:MAG: alpha-2-macroglobulin family protein [Bacteroidota bacterium]
MPKKENGVMLFTDREIYRPGQTIHFKGILYQQDLATPDFKAVEGRPMTVELFDPNRRSIAKATMTSNAFGSFDGTFTAPTGGLTGRMVLKCESEEHEIRVEEYKRPKFEVTLDQLEGDHRLGESIIARGSARSFAGSAVDGATVRYTVSRSAFFPYWNYGGRKTPSRADATIATGTAHTDASGKFEIPFIAHPDSSLDRSELPVFRYTVEADVTDMNGETSSQTTTIAIGYTSLAINAHLPGIFSTHDTTMLWISTSNLNGKQVAATGMVTIEKMREPDHLKRSRLLNPPDRFAMTREEFARDFPNDEYDTPPDDGGEVERIIMQRPFRADTTGKTSVALTDLPPGRYHVHMTARDPSGDTITANLESIAYDPLSNAMPTKAPLLLIEPTEALQPGDTAVILYGTSYRNIHMTIMVERNGDVIREEEVILSDEVRRFAVPITEKERGGITVHISFVRDYRLYEESSDINVPWTNKQLRIETASFRDRMTPGAPQEWRFTITGSSADKVAAEMVATLYDASLDNISPNGGWNRFQWPINDGMISIDNHTFSVAEGDQTEKNWNIRYPSGNNRQEDFDFRIRGGSWLQFRGGFGGDYEIRGGRSMRFSDGTILGSGFTPEYGDVLSGVVNTTGQNGYGIRGGRASETQIRVDGVKVGDPFQGGFGATNSGYYPTVSTLSISERVVGHHDVGTYDKREGGSRGGVTEALSGVNVRKNLNETAFFYPSLTTNEKGEIVIRFTAPEALTRWRMIGFTHTADMKIGLIEKSAVTQKDLMLLTNAPRFLREGDSVTFAVNISNMTKGELKGDVALHLLDATTMQPLDIAWENRTPEGKFTAAKEGGAVSSWSFVVPVGAGPILYRVVAKAGSFSDGEEAPIPVLPNRMLVTETLPMNIRAGQTRTFELAKLVNSGGSPTLRNHRLTLETTSNPAWYAIQALPYLMEFPHECAEQTFERFYANSLASHLVNANPKIKAVFDRWKNSDALLSNLEKNQDVKSVLLEETPWVMQGHDESERRKRVALLFDLNGMANGLNTAMERLRAMQSSDGGWPWFPGMETDRFVTGYIATGFGHLRKLGTESAALEKMEPLIRNAVGFLDGKMADDYQRLRKTKDFDPRKNYLGNAEAQYIYMRSFYPEIQVDGASRESLKFWRNQAAEHWEDMGLMSQGMIALAMSRAGDKRTSAAIIASLRERALHSDELGTYWKYDEGWWWYQAPIETQSVLIEAFNEIAGDQAMVDEMRIWLLKRKQVSDWGTTKATADACYALLGSGSSLLDDDSRVTATIGGSAVDPAGTDGARSEAGTGYSRTTWSGGDIRPQMGSVTLSKSGRGIGWGALYWQYFEQLDRITPHRSPLAIERKLYRVNATDHGPELEPITENSPLHVGDLLRVRIEIRVDRAMEYVHLKDMRGAGLEPTESLSGYRWENGLGYYMSIRDASMNFFFGGLPKGTHVFEYSLRASNAGVYSNGISTIQSMYAPEFASHSQGDIVRIR